MQNNNMLTKANQNCITDLAGYYTNSVDLLFVAFYSQIQCSAKTFFLTLSPMCEIFKSIRFFILKSMKV